MAVVKSSVAYVSTEIVKKGLGVAILPILTRLLSPIEYGIIGTLMACRGFLSQSLSLGMTVSLHRLYFSYGEKQSELRGFLSSNIMFLMFVAGLVCLALDQLAVPAVTEAILGDSKHQLPMRITLWSVYVGLPMAILLPVFASAEKSLIVSLLDTARFVLENTLILLFIGVFTWGVTGYLQGQIVTAGLFMAISTWLLARNFGAFEFRLSYVGKALSFGLPLVPAMILGWVLSISDRLILAHYSTLDDIGFYSLAANLGAMTVMLLAAFERAWTPWFYSSMRNLQGSFLATFSEFMTAWVAIIGSACVIGCVYSKELLAIIVDKAFWSAHIFVPPIMVAAFLVSVYGFAAAFLYHDGRTGVFPMILGIAAIVNLSLNLIFIPEQGAIAAAYTTLIAYVVAAFFYFYFAKVHHRLRIAVFRSGLLLLAIISVSLSPAIVDGVVPRSVLVVLYLVVAFMCVGSKAMRSWPDLWIQIKSA